MNDQPLMPGGYQTGIAALTDLVSLTQLLSAAQDCRTRLNTAIGEIDRMISKTEGARADALRAVERFADENPTSLGVGVCPSLQSGLSIIDGNLSSLERDVRDLLRGAEDKGL